MYKTIVSRKSAGVFAALNRQDAGPLLAGLGEPVHHVMYGQHALGGERHTRETVARWYERLFRLLPDLRFDLGSTLVSGPPWRTTVAVEWQDQALGGTYRNRGVNVIELRWGRVQAIRIHCDTQQIATALTAQAEHGVAEAAAAPLVDEPAGDRGR